MRNREELRFGGKSADVRDVDDGEDDDDDNDDVEETAAALWWKEKRDRREESRISSPINTQRAASGKDAVAYGEASWDSQNVLRRFRRAGALDVRVGQHWRALIGILSGMEKGSSGIIKGISSGVDSRIYTHIRTYVRTYARMYTHS